MTNRSGKAVPLPEHQITGKRRQESIEKQKETVATKRLIKSAIYEDLKKQLVEAKQKGRSYYSQFIEKYLQVALKDPKSKAAQQLASIILKEDVLDILDEQHKKEMENDIEFTRYKILKQFFKEQREVLYEINHSKNILVCCSRRAGKTDLSSGAIVSSALKENSRIIYINLTFTNAVNQIFENVIKRSEAAGLSIKSSSKSSGEIIWENNSSLRIVGNSNNSEIDKLRGESKVSLVIIDEFFHQRNMEYGINEVISPLMLDRKDSSILCLGTPPRIPKTYGEKCWTEEKLWKKFHWTARANPYIPEFDEWLKSYCENKGISIDAPFIQREYEGKIGVYDIECMVFKDYKTYKEIDNFVAERIDIGVDFGFEDYTSIIALAYNNKEAYVIAEKKFNKTPVSEIINNISDVYNYCREWLVKNNKHCDLSNINIYGDTSDKDIIYELYTVQKLPAYPCYKYDKNLAIAQLAEFCRTGKIKVLENNVLSDEFDRILYKRDEDDNIISEIDDDMFHPDAMFALLYASRQMWYNIGAPYGTSESVIEKQKEWTK